MVAASAFRKVFSKLKGKLRDFKNSPWKMPSGMFDFLKHLPWPLQPQHIYVYINRILEACINVFMISIMFEDSIFIVHMMVTDVYREKNLIVSRFSSFSETQ